jgi:hypothetical protein
MIGAVRNCGLAMAIVFVVGSTVRSAEVEPDLKRVAWVGPGTYRVLVKVDPQKLGDRKSDEIG